MEAGSHFTWLDFIVLTIYFFLSMGVGGYFYFTGKSRDTEGYTAAGRSLPGIVVGLSILATYLSSISFLALPGNAYKGNWNSFVFSLSLPLAAWIAVKYFVPFYRSRGEVSAYHHLEARFGPWARLYTGIMYLLMQSVRMGSVTFLMALPLKELLGWDVATIIIITGVSVTLYSLVGGIVAVIWADAIQSVVLMGGALVCLALMLFRMPEGVDQMFAVAAEKDKFSLGSFGPSLMEKTFWVVLLYGVFINLNNFGIDQNFVQRYAASKSDKEATKSLWLGSLLYIPVSSVFFFIGTALFAFYQANADQLPERYADPAMSDRVFPWFIVSQLPPGVTGLLIAAIECPDPVIFLEPLYVSTLIFGTVGTGIALVLIRAEGILDTWWILQGIFAGGMLGLFLLGMVSRRATNPAAIIGVLVGLFVIAWMSTSPLLVDKGILPESLENPLDGNLTILFGTTTIILVGLMATQLLPNRPNSQ